MRLYYTQNTAHATNYGISIMLTSALTFHVDVMKSTGRDKTEDEKIRIQEKRSQHCVLFPSTFSWDCSLQPFSDFSWGFSFSNHDIF